MAKNTSNPSANPTNDLPPQEDPNLDLEEQDDLEEHEEDQAGALPPDVVEVDEQELHDVDMALVIIERDASTKTPTTVFAHEIPILQDIHGEDVVHVQREYVGQTTMDAEQAHVQLLAKYKQHHEVVKAYFPRANKLARVTGLPEGVGNGGQLKQSVMMIGGKEVRPAR